MKRDRFSHVFDYLVDGFSGRDDAVTSYDLRREVRASVLNHNCVLRHFLGLLNPACRKMLARVPLGTTSGKMTWNRHAPKFRRMMIMTMTSSLSA